MNKKFLPFLLSISILSSCQGYKGDKISVPYQEEGGLISYSVDSLIKDYTTQTLVVLLNLKNQVPCSCLDDKKDLDSYAKEKHFYIYDLMLDYDDEHFFDDYDRVLFTTIEEGSLHLSPIEEDEDGKKHLPLFPVLMVYYAGFVGVLKTEKFIDTLNDYVICEKVV